jgi:hypothetical protein
MMLRGFLLEYTGTLLIVAALLFTHANPFAVGIAYTAALSIDPNTEGYFTPLGVLVKYVLGRLSSSHALKLIGVQIAAALSIVLLYTGRNGLYAPGVFRSNE